MQTHVHLTGKHYIHNHWVDSKGSPFSSVNPANNNLLWQGCMATPHEVNNAFHAAQQSLPAWSLLSVDERANYMKEFAKQVELRRADLAEIISCESGKPHWEALTEVSAVIGKINISIEAYHERTAEKTTSTPDGSSCLRFKPHGVVAVLGAFNFPAHLSNGHIVPALLAGNTVIYKPSELTPAVAEVIMQCWHASHLPSGVINCIQGGSTTGQHLLEQDIQGVYFTGSYQTGKKINALFSDRPEVILALEMGGNNALVIDEVKDMNAALYISLLSTLMTAGQRCTCARRLLVPESSWGDTFLKEFISTCQTIKIGPHTELPEPFMGPIIRHEHALAHLQTQQQLIDLGGKSLLKMTLLKDKTGLLSPGIIDMTKVKNPPDDEIFAPFIQVYRYKNFKDAIHLANQTRYGLVAGLISDDPNHYQMFYNSIKAGLINWNKATTGAASNLPFGGVGLSGNHRPSAYFAADYCAYPVASQEQTALKMPEKKLPGVNF